MGNGLSPCLCPGTAKGKAAAARLVFWGGSARTMDNERRFATAGDVTAELSGDHLVCAADSFFIGLPVPALPAGEELLPGRTYFVLPAARLSNKALTAATLASLSPTPAKVSLAGAACPFEYVTGGDGAALIRVLPEFIEKVITSCGGGGKCGAADQLCSTPELRKHYMQLVGARAERPWSPGLETISEGEKRRRMLSPVRLVGLAKASSR
ncbi:hypothetical protein PR202_ga04514 [Eleusine coracana subsp. coracana]|uniref:Uncharacterized protein n=1 Tax=Eleusine coracana subsp. coracana TaxID=191504 RepID=A0AAV5BQ29_ELECO|nr:hypothetical protein QOZ80_5AG0375000 [Eleusine coracana subsp. coracana]GJM88453.1 hypothetical protein PR202_ga04514 [Eleusine coracana subsp. coracana]